MIFTGTIRGDSMKLTMTQAGGTVLQLEGTRLEK
jgi:hypothetical protein